MAKAETEKIVDFSGTDYTCVTFSPDLSKFKMEKLDDDFVALIKRRAYDMAGVCRGVSVILNGEKIKVLFNVFHSKFFHRLLVAANLPRIISAKKKKGKL